MNIFISGGCKNGKSYHAQELARQMANERQVPLYYLATMIPADDEDRARIRRHLAEREGWGFDTIERGRDICGILPQREAGADRVQSAARTVSGARIDSRGVFLLDSVTALLSNEMFPPGGKIDTEAGSRLAAELADFARRTGNTVFVSDYLYSDARHFDAYTETYRKALAAIDYTLAHLCDQVIEVSFGMKFLYRP